MGRTDSLLDTHERNILLGGPWAGLPAPPPSAVAYSNSRLWVVRMHDDPVEFIPCFVESCDRPQLCAPAVALGFYTSGMSGWPWTEMSSEELDQSK